MPSRPKRPLDSSISATDRSSKSPRFESPDAGDSESATNVVSHTQQETLNEDQRKALLESLAFDQIDSRHDSIEKAYGKTCEWLSRTSEYIDWFESPDKLVEHHGFLWIRGHPGAGKSTLMKSALHKAQKTKRGTFISFFFNARGDELEKSTMGMYRSLLFQLLRKIPRLQTTFGSLGRTARNWNISQWSVELLKSLFRHAVQNLEQSPLTCFIDALDECGVDQIRNMILFFEELGETAVSVGISFRVCLSSRHYPYITISKGLSLDLGRQQGHNQDIASFVQGKLKIGRDKRAQQIRTQLIEKASGIFIWIVLVVGILQQEYDDGHTHSLSKRLEDIPGDLNQLFRDILSRDSRNKDELLLCIQWVLFAKKPLGKEQLYLAIRVGVDPIAVSKWDPEEVDDADMRRFILSSSKGLVEVNRSRKYPRVQFIHESVREFFLKDGLTRIWPELKRDFRGESHERLKQCCIEYIRIADASAELEYNRPDFPGQYKWGTWWKRDVSESARKVLKLSETRFPLLEYAIQTVFHHANAAANCGVDQVSFLHSFDLASWMRFEAIFETFPLRLHLPTTSLLYILAEHDAAKLIESHPDKLSGFEAEVGDEKYGMPLLAAVATNSRQAVYAFLKAQANAEPPTSSLHSLCEQYNRNKNTRRGVGRTFEFSKKKTAFINIVAAGDDIVVAFALACAKIDSDIDWRGTEGANALINAIRAGPATIVQLFLDKGAVFDAGQNGMSSLHVAAHKGDDAMMRVFLANGANPEAATGAGQTPLFFASQGGHVAAIQLLVDRGTDVNVVDKDNRTPLCVAAQGGHVAAIQLLVDRGADLNIVARDGSSILQDATYYGQEAAVQLLLELGADIKVGKKYGDSVLHTAAGRWFDEKLREMRLRLVRLLLRYGADMNEVNGSGYTPLHSATEARNVAIVQLLLDKGANIEATCNKGYTPMLLAADSGLKYLLQIFLTKGANIKAQTKDHHSALHLALPFRNKAIVQLLIDHGADIQQACRCHPGPLHIATLLGDEEIVELLLDQEADINATDPFGNTLLHIASKAMPQILELLLRRDTNIYAVNYKGQTPLHVAVQVAYHAANTQLLLDRGANIYAVDKDGNTPLSLASSLLDDNATKRYILKKDAERDTTA